MREKHSSLEKELSSGQIDKKLFAEKSKEYSEINEIITDAKKYLSFENDKIELEMRKRAEYLKKKYKYNPDRDWWLRQVIKSKNNK